VDLFDRLRTALAALPGAAEGAPEGGRIGAALVLLRVAGEGDLEIVYTRRHDDLRSHPGQISFPGGRVDAGETVEAAALREAFEEVALDPSTVTVLGRLPAFYIPPSRFWLQPVVARWDAPHDLVGAEAEVADVLTVRVSTLKDRQVWRAVRMATLGESWAWSLGDGHLLWGATGMVTAVLLGLLDPDWSGGTVPADLSADLHVEPWRAAPTAVRPAVLSGVEERSIEQLTAAARRAPLAESAAAAGRAVAGAVERLQMTGHVVVLIGPGFTGAVGAVVASILAQGAREVTALLSRSAGLHTATRGPLAQAEAAGAAVEVFEGVLPQASVMVDALIGRGLRGPLRGAPLEIVRALRNQMPKILAVDLPSGLDPEGGLIGEVATADLTIAVGAPAPWLYSAGAHPFVGDLYTIALDGGASDLVRVVPAAP
jgi:hydroxyethylthiazole kinase-like uncharacterized protein yjeF